MADRNTQRQPLLRFEAGDLQRQVDALLGLITLALGMLEAGTVLPAGWPQWSADPHVIGFCQSLKVSVGWGGAVVLRGCLLVQNSTQWAFSSLMLLNLSLAGRWLLAL